MNYKDKKSLVIYFSRAFENYAVGYVEKGSIEYVKDIVGADAFKRLWFEWKENDYC